VSSRRTKAKRNPPAPRTTRPAAALGDDGFGDFAASDTRFLTKTDSVTEWIRNLIITGSLKPGTPLMQQDIAKRIGVSPTPVREAFGILEAQGLVERRPHRGVVVADAQQDMEDVYELRGFLEVLAARRAAQRKDVDLSELQTSLNEAGEALKIPDLQRFRRAALNFHAGLARASGSPTIVEVTGSVLARSFFNVPMDRIRAQQSQAAHAAMLRAIRGSDAKSAGEAAGRHIRSFIEAAKRARSASQTGGGRRGHRDKLG
jgi:DNA-binding GntR family transcriptional regulator